MSPVEAGLIAWAIAAPICWAWGEWLKRRKQ